MSGRQKLINIELSQPIAAISNLGSYSLLRAVLHWHGVAIGEISLPIVAGEISLPSLLQGIFPQVNQRLCRQIVVNRLLNSAAQDWRLATLLTMPPPQLDEPLPLLTIGFIVRSSSDFATLSASLQALQQLNGDAVVGSGVAGVGAGVPLEVFVIEAVPIDNQVQQWVQSQFPKFQYLQTQTPSLNAARNLAIEKAQGSVIAFTDDRAIVTPQWASALAHTFAAHPEVMAVTGWVIPSEIEQDFQAKLEQFHSASRGDQQRWYRLNKLPSWMDLGTMQLGSDMNMAFRRSLFDRVGKFDLALDAPGTTWGGGGLEMWNRILLTGESLLYEPSALVRWRMPQTEPEILAYLRHEILGLYAYLSAGQQRFPNFAKLWWTLGIWKFTRLCITLVAAFGNPRAWTATEIQAVLQSFGNFQRFGNYGRALSKVSAMPPTSLPIGVNRTLKSQAVRLVDVTQPLPDLLDITDYRGVRLYVQAAGKLLGKVTIANHGASVSRQRLAREIADQLLWELLAIPYGNDPTAAKTETELAINQHWRLTEAAISPPTVLEPLALSTSVSIIITTCDRPQDLTCCLTYLTQQQTERSVEIIVADNRPSSGLSKAVVDQFPGVRYVTESRAGSSYGRNAAILASRGEIIVTVDDDVVVPGDWLEKLLVPMARPEVAAVMGNLLPLELETESQYVFEELKGGLSQGWKRFEVDRAWIDSYSYSPPIWELGVSANAAFRASIFAEPQVGLMDEVLGAGTPCCGGEETYLIYKLLRAGHTLVYEPDAYAWHRHRNTMTALCKQWHGYMRSATAYHLNIWLQDHDRRGLNHILLGLPQYLVNYVLDRARNQHQVPWAVMRSEVSGFFMGFWGYYKSVRRVKRLGRSQPYVPPLQRTKGAVPIEATQLEASSEQTTCI